MPMRAMTVRFSEDLWQLLEDEATRQGISAAQFVRDATIVRLAFLAGRSEAVGDFATGMRSVSIPVIEADLRVEENVQLAA
jgi:hypothetical protein